MKMNMENETITGKRILLVDDEAHCARIGQNFAGQGRTYVVEANNGAEAYNLFTQGQFDLVMTDCVMPFLSGDELAVRIRQFAPQQPILMITGDDFKRGPQQPGRCRFAQALRLRAPATGIGQAHLTFQPSAQSPTTTALV